MSATVSPRDAARSLITAYNDRSNDGWSVDSSTCSPRPKIVIDQREAARIEDALEKQGPDYAKVLRGEIKKLAAAGEIDLTAAGKQALLPPSQRPITAEQQRQVKDRIALDQQILQLLGKLEASPAFADLRPQLAKLRPLVEADLAAMQKIERTQRAPHGVPTPPDVGLGALGRIASDATPAALAYLNRQDWNRLDPIQSYVLGGFVRLWVDAAT